MESWLTWQALVWKKGHILGKESKPEGGPAQSQAWGRFFLHSNLPTQQKKGLVFWWKVTLSRTAIHFFITNFCHSIKMQRPLRSEDAQTLSCVPRLFLASQHLEHLNFTNECLSSIHYCYYSVAKLCPTLLRPHGLYPARLLCPWDFPGKNTGVGCHFLLQGIFSTQGLNPPLLHWQAGSLPNSHLWS